MKKSQNVKISQVFKEYWKGIRPNKYRFFYAVTAFITAQVIGIFIPLYYKDFFDVLGKSSDKLSSSSALIWIITMVLILHLIGWAFRRTAMICYNRLESGTMSRLKQNGFDNLLYHSYSFFSNNFTGSLIQKVNRFTRSFEVLLDITMFNIMPLVVYLVGSVVITWFVAPIISIVIMIWVAIFLIFNFFFSRWKLKYDIEVAMADSKTTAYLADAVTNNNTISFFNGHEYETKGFKEVTLDQMNKIRRSWNLGEIVEATQSFLITFAEFFVFYYTIKYWENGLATIGTFVLVQTYIIGLAQNLWGTNNMVRKITEAIADSKEMVDILTTPIEIQDVPNAKEMKVNGGKIEFKNINFNFSDSRQILSDVNLKINAGEKVAIIGPSGAGKTTLVRLIMRLYDLTSGVLSIDDQDIHLVSQDSLRHNVSFVPQDPILFHRTLMDNIRYGRREATDAEVIEAAKLAHCHEFIDQLKDKYETFVGERGIKLSGGERQRVAIARAILKRSPILILDEATSSLDSHSEALIQDALDNLMKNCTTIVIAHRLSTIKKMDRIISMQNGKIIEEGTHAELANKDGGLYKKLWNLQVSGFIAE